jgi:hypothetical protein
MANEVFLGAEADRSQGVWLEHLWLHSLCKLLVSGSLLMSLEPLANSPSPDQPGKTRESLLKQVIRLKGKCLLVGYGKVRRAHLLGVCEHRLHICEGHSSRVIPLTLAIFIFAGLKHIFDFCRAGRVSLPPLLCVIESPSSSVGIICPSLV